MLMRVHCPQMRNYGSNIFDMPCFPHIVNLIGEKLDIPLASQFIRHLASIFSFSHASRMEWRELSGSAFPSHSQTRWYSLFQVAAYVAKNFHTVIRFLETSQYGMTVLTFGISCTTLDIGQMARL